MTISFPGVPPAAVRSPSSNSWWSSPSSRFWPPCCCRRCRRRKLRRRKSVALTTEDRSAWLTRFMSLTTRVRLWLSRWQEAKPTHGLSSFRRIITPARQSAIVPPHPPTPMVIHRRFIILQGGIISLGRQILRGIVTMTGCSIMRRGAMVTTPFVTGIPLIFWPIKKIRR